MPKIPQINTGQGLVETQIANQPRMTNQDVSSGTMRLAKGLGDIGVAAQKIKEKRDTAEAESLLLDFEKAKNDVLFNPKDGYYNAQGQAAVDGYAPTQQKLDALLKDYRSRVKNPAIGDIFNRAANARLGGDQKSMASHASKGQRVWDIANQKAEQENAINNGSLYYNDDKQLELQIVSGRDAAIQSGQLEGITGKPQQEAADQVASAVIENAITAAIVNKNLPRAELLRERYDKQLQGKERNTVDKAISAKKTSNEVASETVRIWDATATLEENIKQANKIEDPEIRLEVLGNLNTLHIQNQKIVAQNKVNMIDDASAQIAQGRNVLDLDPEMLEAIGDDGVRLLKVRQVERDTGRLQTTDWAVYQDLMSNPEAWVKDGLPLGKMQSLNEQERNEVQALWKAYQDPSSSRNKAKFNYEFGVTKAQQVKGVVEQMLGKTPSKYTDLDRIKANWFNEELNSRLQAAQESLPEKRKLTPEEFTETLKGFTAEVAIGATSSNWIGDANSIQDINEDDWTRILEIIDESGAPSSPEMILEIYKRGVEAGEFSD